MGRASLKGVELKLERAKDHFEALANSITMFLRNPETYAMVLETDKQRRPVLRVEDVEEPSPGWGVLIGDCVHNLRSALDHLAFQLMLGNTSGRLPRELVKSSAFPIYLSSREFGKLRSRGAKRGQPTPDSGLHKIRGISPRAKTIIESLQPYHRRKHPRTRGLWELQELWNADKHRLPPLVYSSFQVDRFEVVGSVPFALTEFESVPGRLKRDAVVARWGYIADAQPIRMHVNADMATDITFGKGPRTPYSVRGQSVLLTIHGAMSFIADEVVPPLADDLGLPFEFSAGRLIDTSELSPAELAAFRSSHVPTTPTVRHA